MPGPARRVPLLRERIAAILSIGALALCSSMSAASQVPDSAGTPARALGSLAAFDPLHAPDSLASLDSAATLETCRGDRLLRANEGDFAAWREAAERCLALARSIHGREDPATLKDLCVLVRAFIAVDSTMRAASLLEEGRRIVDSGATVDDDARAAYHDARSVLARAQGRTDEAIEALRAAMDLRRPSWGAQDPREAGALADLADLLQTRGDLAEADSLLRRSIAILEASVGPTHPDLAEPLNNLGVVLRRKGDLTGAVAAYRRALEIQIAATGEEHPSAANLMLNLSAALQAIGREAESIRLLRRAVAIFEERLGPEHTRTAKALSHLAAALRRRGDLAEAEALFARCHAIGLRTLGPDHLDVVLYRIGLAECRRDQGRLAEARADFQAAIDTASRLLGRENHEVARYRRELGLVLLSMGRIEESRAVLEACTATLERSLGPNHPALNRCLSGLTVLDLIEHDTEAARLHADRNLAIAERTFGEQGLRRSLLLQLAVDAVAGRWEEALATGVRASTIAQQIQDDLFAVSSEREILEHAEHQRHVLATLLAALARVPDPADSSVAHAFALAVRSHGQVVDRLAERRRRIEMEAAPTEAREIFAEYAQASEKLAAQVLRGAGAHPAAFRAETSRLRSDKEAIERRLAERSEPFRNRLEARRRESEFSSESLVEAIPPGARLLQFVRYPRLTIGSPDWRAGGTSPEECLFSGGEERYGLFLLTREERSAHRLQFVEIGAAPAIDSLVARYRAAVESVEPDRRPTARQEAEYRDAARRLFDTLITPLAPDSAATDPLWLILPVSQLQRIDFGSLIDPGGRLLIERARLHLLSSARDLQTIARPPARGGNGILAVGNPTNLPASVPCIDASAALPELAGAREEAEIVAGLARGIAPGNPSILTGSDATETAVKARIEGRRIVHLAAHGFFCEAARSVGAARGARAEEEMFRSSPLLSCGLLLGAGGDDDGMLTAQEIACRDLRGTDWVVLSACNSGLGRMVSGEGLYGLRRAFEIAGARTVLMSLWRIGDATARGTMRRIYENRAAGMSTLDAVRSAELAGLEESRRRWNRIHPALWGGIVAEGDWR